MFSIKFINDEYLNGDPEILVGHIVAGSLDERFDCPVDFWLKEDYETSWRRELWRLSSGASQTAALLTSVMIPEHANFLRGYTLFRFDDEIRMNERLFIMDQLDAPLDLDRPGDSVGDYEEYNDDGHKISEWRFPVIDIKSFLGHQNA